MEKFYSAPPHIEDHNYCGKTETFTCRHKRRSVPPHLEDHIYCKRRKRHQVQLFSSPPDSRSGPVLQCEVPLMIHGYSVDDYQRIYHSVVDDMTKYKTGSPHPYSLDLGRRIKQRLWEKLGRPKVTMVENSEGAMDVHEDMSASFYPPYIHVDISFEPEPQEPLMKKERLEN